MKVSILILSLFFVSDLASASEVSFTMDDPSVQESVLITPVERNQKILKAFGDRNLKAMLFTCGKRIDSPAGGALLKSWDEQGHLIANHSYSHLNFNSDKISFETYRDDFLKAEPLISTFKNFRKYFRFPFLKEGNTEAKRDQMRSFLKKNGYSQGYVTIDASDWYIDGRLVERLQKNPKADLKPYRDFYLKHIWNRTQYYDALAKKIYGREIKHTLLIHHSLLNALFLDDLMRMYQRKGWKLISLKRHLKTPCFHMPLRMHQPEKALYGPMQSRPVSLVCAILPKTATMKKRKWIG